MAVVQRTVSTILFSGGSSAALRHPNTRCADPPGAGCDPRVAAGRADLQDQVSAVYAAIIDYHPTYWP